MSEDKKDSLFKKILHTTNTYLDMQVQKSKADLSESEVVEDFIIGKSVVENPDYTANSMGYKDKPTRLSDYHLKMMAKQDTIVSAVIQTRQNQVSGFSKYVKGDKQKGWAVRLRDEDTLLEELKEKIREEKLKKIEGIKKSKDASEDTEDSKSQEQEAQDTDDEASLEWDVDREAQAKLEEMYAEEKKEVVAYIMNCGLTENRSFESRKWKIDSALRAMVRDSLTYDKYACEIVPTLKGTAHSWFPVDSSTIKKSTLSLRHYKKLSESLIGLDFLYPEKVIDKIEEENKLELDEQKLEDGEYRWVQFIQGRVERAFTDKELKVGIRNPTTDIYYNGYGISELELLINMVTGHINAEFYNQAYFTQGFSAKGFLHIKAAISRRKVEMIRTKWNHMIKGSANSSQTPIFAGMDEVKWVPLTGNPVEMGFSEWMRYLVKIICAVYQIDPNEIGIAFKEDKTALGGDDTEAKNRQSQDKGLYPLLTHLGHYITENILKPFDDRFVFEFVGITGETRSESITRQKEESAFKLTVNEIRAEDGLRPIPGGDDLILNDVYFQWYDKYSPEGKKLAKETRDQEMEMQQEAGMGMPEDGSPEAQEEPDLLSEIDSFAKSKSKKPSKVKVEYYTIDSDEE